MPAHCNDGAIFESRLNPDQTIMKSPFSPFRVLMILSAALAMLAPSVTRAANRVWNVGSPGSNTWSTIANWNPSGTPTITDTILFTNVGVSSIVAGGATVGATNNVVDQNLAVGALLFTQTNDFSVGTHTTLILPGVNLFVGSGGLGINNKTNNNGILFGSITNYATITGHGTLLMTNASGLLQASSANGQSRTMAILDMSTLDTLLATNISQVSIGFSSSATTMPRAGGTIFLAKTNVIVAVGTSPQVIIGDNTGNGNSDECILYLGQTNSIYADNIALGRQKQTARIAFGPAFVGSSPSVLIRGHTAGPMVLWTIGDNNSSGSSTSCSGICDFSAGTIDALATDIVVGRGEAASSAATGSGTLTFNSGTVAASTVEIGATASGTATSAGVGTVNVNGAGILSVTNILTLASATSTTAATRGTLNVVNGTVWANSMAAGAGLKSTNNVIAGTLVVTNTAGTLAAPITALNISNATLRLAASQTTTNMAVGLLNVLTGSTTNVINISSAPAISTDPMVIPIVSYSASSGNLGTLGLGALPAATPAYRGYLSNDTTHSTVDLVYTTNHPPTIANIVTNAVDPGLTWKIAIPALATAAGWGDADGDTVTLSQVGPTSNLGTSVTTSGGFILYNGTVNAEDFFSYVVTDGTLTATNKVYLEAAVNPGQTSNITATNVVGGSITLAGAGIPNRTNSVERTTSLTPPITWTPIGTVTNGPNGLWQFTDPSPTSPAFYRAVTQP